jgi:multimeric flavodoxin WrbA
MDKGNTSLILEPFVEGLEAGGVEVELFYTRRLNVYPCLGDRSCWKRTPGECVQKDDMRMLLPKVQRADIIVLAVPVYFDGMPGPMKNVFDRLLPLLEPFFEMRKNHCRHPSRGGRKPAKFVLVSNCGFWEMDNFDPLVIHVKAICRNMGWEYAGALLRPHGEALGYMVRRGYPVQDVFEAARQAGKELACKGKMSERTLQMVRRELLPQKQYAEMTNKGFTEALSRLKKQ